MRHRPSKAFTLIEVILALAIFTLAITTLSQSVVNTLQVKSKMIQGQKQEHDLRLLRQEILNLSERETIEDGGRFQSHYQGNINWQARIEPLELLDLFRLTITVSFPEEDKEMELYVLRPSWTTVSERQLQTSDARKRVRDNRPLNPNLDLLQT